MARRQRSTAPRMASRRRPHTARVRRVSSEQNPIDNIEVVDGGGGHAQIHVKSGNLTVFTIHESYNTENYYVMQIERLRNRTSSGVGSYLIYPTEFPYLWEFSHFHNGMRELVPDYLLDEMADELEDIWRSSEFSNTTSSRRANRRVANGFSEQDRLYGFRQAENIINYFGKKTVKHWINGDPMGYAIQSQLDELDHAGTIAEALVELVGGKRANRMESHNRPRPSRFASRRKVSDNRYREWSEIHKDYKLVDENGTRLVLFNDGGNGTVLGPWIGPDGNRSARRANRRYATSNKTSLLSSEFSGMGWANGHTGLVGHFVAYDDWLWDMVRAGTISGPKELEREFMGGRARELERMSDIDWSQVDWNDVYDFLNGK